MSSRGCSALGELGDPTALHWGWGSLCLDAAVGEVLKERMVFTPNFKGKEILAETLSADCSPFDAGWAEITPAKSKCKTCLKLDFGSPCILSFPYHPSSEHCDLPSPPAQIFHPFSLPLKAFITEECKKITAKSFCVTGKSLQH